MNHKKILIVDTLISVMGKKQQHKAEFAKRLRALRELKGMTQLELARASGTTQRAISSYENKAGYPPATAIIKLAHVLEVSSDELLGLKAVKKAKSEDDFITRRLWKKFKQVRTLPEKDQRAIVRLVNSLIASGSRVE